MLLYLYFKLKRNRAVRCLSKGKNEDDYAKHVNIIAEVEVHVDKLLKIIFFYFTEGKLGQ